MRLPMTCSEMNLTCNHGATTRACLKHPSEKNCTGLNPLRSACSQHPTVLASSPVPGGDGAPPAVGKLVVYYSHACRTKWAAYISGETGRSTPDSYTVKHSWVSLTRRGDLYQDDQENSRLSTDMLYAPLGNAYYACNGMATVGVEYWTGYTSVEVSPFVVNERL